MGTVAGCDEPLFASFVLLHSMPQKTGTHGSVMNKSLTTNLLTVCSLAMALTFVGCAAGTGGLASSPSPVFPKSSTLDYSSQLETLQARTADSPYVPAGGFEDRPTRGPLFSMGSGSRGPVRSGSC